MSHSQTTAVITGASSGIGHALARLAKADGHHLIIAADRPEIHEVAAELGAEAVEADLSTEAGVDQLLQVVGNRPVSVLCANAGHGLGHAFLDQDWAAAKHVVATNVIGTMYLVQKIGQRMRDAGTGQILFTGSIAGHIPGSFQAVYNGTKAFIDNFAPALRNELKDSGVTVTNLQPGATETEFFDRAGMEDTKVGQAKKDDPADVAKTGWEAMKAGKEHVTHGLMNKAQMAVAAVAPPSVLAGIHRKTAEPGTDKA